MAVFAGVSGAGKPVRILEKDSAVVHVLIPDENEKIVH